MQDILSMVQALRRPRLLIRAARAGADEYRRDVHLPRALGCAVLPRHGAALMRLLEIEIALDDDRRQGATSYSVSRHIEVLSVMMGEARLMRAAQPL